MSSLFALRILMDLCYYMFAVGSLASCAKHSGMLLTSPLLFAFSSFFVHLAFTKAPKKRWLQAILVLPGASSLFFVHTAVDWVVTVPMFFYLWLLVGKQLLYVDYDSTLTRFFNCLKLLPVPAILAIIASNGQGALEVMLPYLFLFLILSVMLLRMLRHSDRVLQDRKFRIISMAEVLAVIGIGWLFTTGMAIRALQFLGNTLMIYILRPICNGLLFLLSGVAWVINKIFSGIDWSIDEEALMQLKENLGTSTDAGDQAVMEFYEEASQDSQTTQALTWILIGLAAIVVIVLVIVLFRILLRSFRRPADNDFADERSRMAEDEDPSAKRLGFSARDRVRSVYRKFLKLAVKAGLDETANYTSQDVSYEVRNRFPATPMEDLRQTYLRARYSSEEITGEDVKQAKAMLGKLQKNP